MPPSSPRQQVFISYSHADAAYLARLQVFLKPRQRAGVIDVWDDTRIRPGDDWKARIAGALQTAKVAVLLVSADFFASDFIHAEELPALLRAAERDGATILPLIVGHSHFLDSGLSVFQAVNAPAEPLCAMSSADRDREFNKLARRIDEIFAESAVVPAPAEEEATDEAAASGEVFHPGNRAHARGALLPCCFYIGPFFHRTGLWRTYGDVQVEVLKARTADEVYLIPSGAAPPRLRDTRFLRDPAGAPVLARKQELTRAFVESFRNRMLDGFMFEMQTRTGDIRTKVYCAAYDEFLRRGFADG